MTETFFTVMLILAMIITVSYWMGKASGLAENEKNYNYTRMQQARRMLYAEPNTTHKTDKENN